MSEYQEKHEVTHWINPCDLYIASFPGRHHTAYHCGANLLQCIAKSLASFPALQCELQVTEAGLKTRVVQYVLFHVNAFQFFALTLFGPPFVYCSWEKPQSEAATSASD